MLEFIVPNDIENLEEILSMIKEKNIVDAKIVIRHNDDALSKADIVLSSVPKKRLRQIAKICKTLSHDGSLPIEKNAVIHAMKEIGITGSTALVYFSGAIKAKVIEKSDDVYILGEYADAFYVESCV